MERDNIDFGKENISALFKRMFYPTVLGMLFTALFTITDGVFVGQGIGSDALASVNIVAPLWLFATGVGLMFGMGGSVVASIHLSHGKIKAARINTTQALLVSSLLLIAVSALTVIFIRPTLHLLGCSEELMTLAHDYLLGFAPFMATNALLISAGFFLRLSGVPRYAMVCGMVATILNLILDYVFIFVMQWGTFGAAIATSLGTIAGTIMMLVYLFKKSSILHFVRIKMSVRSLKLTARNIGYMSNVGFSSFLCELAISCMMLIGNYVFISLSHEAGVAAFSIACYFLPIAFMLDNSIAQSAQPIISYNYGKGMATRVRKALIIALNTAIIYGVIITLLTILFSSEIAAMFVSSESPAHEIATLGLPLFALALIPLAVNIISIGYFQSVERTVSANSITMLRGFILLIASFIVMSHFWGIAGAWLAVPVSETATTMVVIALYLFRKKR